MTKKKPRLRGNAEWLADQGNDDVKEIRIVQFKCIRCPSMTPCKGLPQVRCCGCGMLLGLQELQTLEGYKNMRTGKNLVTRLRRGTMADVIRKGVGRLGERVLEKFGGKSRAFESPS